MHFMILVFTVFAAFVILKLISYYFFVKIQAHDKLKSSDVAHKSPGHFNESAGPKRSLELSTKLMPGMIIFRYLLHVF